MEKVKIKLEDGIDIIMNRNITNTKLMTAIGMMIQMLAVGEMDGTNKISKDKFKSMMNMYIDKIWDTSTDIISKKKE